jgi:cyanophycinase
MSGTIVLQGGGPFVCNDELDRRFVSDHHRVVVLPTADAFEQPQVLVDAAVDWGGRIGVEVVPLMVMTRGQADDAAAAVIDDVSAVMLVGDSASHLRSVLKGTPVFEAIVRVAQRDGLVVAAGACAAALCDPMTDRRGGAFALGLGLVPGLAVITESETWPADKLDRAHDLATTPVVDLPTGSALVKSEAAWELIGDALTHGDLPPLP